MMTQNRLMVLSIMLSCVAGMGAIAYPAAAQDAVAPQPIQDDNAVQRPAADTGVLNSVDDKVSGGNIRLSELIGMDIENPAGEDIGEIDDLVLDAQTGKVRYAAVTYGGFLGLGNKLFAVPFEAFKFQREPGDADDIILVLNISENQLEASQGFDKDHWPNWSDPNFARDLNQRYGLNRAGEPNRGVDVNIGGRNGVDVKVD